MTTCPACGRHQRDGVLCAACTRDLRDALTELAPGRPQLPSHATGTAGRGTTLRWDMPTAVVVGGLAGQLDVAAARLARIGAPAPAGGIKPPPFHEKAAGLRDLLRATLAPWARHMLELECPTPQPPACRHRDPVGVDCRACTEDVPARHAARVRDWNTAWAATITGDIGAMAAYLLTRIHLLTSREDAADLHHAVTTTVERVERVIDRPADEWFAGECGAELPDGTVCPVPLYCEPGATFVTCDDRAGLRGCGTTWSVAERRAWLLKSAEDYLDTATGIATALTSLDQPVTAARIWKWKQRGKLLPHSHEVPPPCRGHQGIGRQATCEACAAREGAPLYRLGDVVDLLVADLAATERRRQRTAS